MQRSILSWIATLAVAFLTACPGFAATVLVDCNAAEKIQAKLADAKPGDVIQVKGTCNESVQIASETVRLTRDGLSSAIINAPQGRDGVFIRGRDIVVRGFTITGGRDVARQSG